MAEVTIRAYQAADREAMFALDRECFAEVFRFNRRAMRGFAEARGAVVLVAEEAGGALAGFVIVQVEGGADMRHGYVQTLDVAPRHRRSRLATRLMHEAERRVAAFGVRMMMLHVHTENEAALRFYEHAGYAQIGEEPDYYSDEIGAFVYRKEL